MMAMTGQTKQITGQHQHQLHQSMLMMSPPPKQQQQSLLAEGGNSTAGTPAVPSQKKPGLYRYTRNQDGILFIGRQHEQLYIPPLAVDFPLLFNTLTMMTTASILSYDVHRYPRLEAWPAESQ